MRRTKTWLITDTHFNHRAMVLNGWRPKDYEAKIMKHWGHLVAERDKVIHLGDVILGMNGTLKDLLDCLPGRKYLVRGNHDHESDDWYMNHGFDFVCQGMVYGGVYFSHAPSLTLPQGADLNVHGHLHDDKHRGDNTPAHCKLLSLEVTDYHPVLFEDFVGRLPSREVHVGDYVGVHVSDHHEVSVKEENGKEE